MHIKDHKTRYIFDPFGYLGQKRKQLLERPWAGVFRDHIRPILRYICSPSISAKT
jgi:hypothetical protein